MKPSTETAMALRTLVMVFYLLSRKSDALVL
jgi:hypothetical protein